MKRIDKGYSRHLADIQARAIDLLIESTQLRRVLAASLEMTIEAFGATSESSVECNWLSNRQSYEIFGSI